MYSYTSIHIFQSCFKGSVVNGPLLGAGGAVVVQQQHAGRHLRANINIPPDTHNVLEHYVAEHFMVEHYLVEHCM